MSDRPVLCVTLGDPSGIGPELACALAARPPAGVALLLCGDARVLARAAAVLSGSVPSARTPPIPLVAGPDELRARGLSVGLDAASDALGRAAMPDTLPPTGLVDARAGAASHGWVRRGAELAGSGAVEALVTGPIHKEAWGLAGVVEPGHTDALARWAGVARVVMLMAGGPLRVTLATIHVPLRAVPDLLTTDGLLADLRIVARDAKGRLGLPAPRIAVCGLNPHAGEGGRFGDEDRRVVRPAVEAARAEGIDASGPWPADACLPKAAAGAYDLVHALYHDQGLVAVKTLAPRRAVNVTLGLPYVRTSVDHGTAFDVAGRGVADPSSLEAAVAFALRMTGRGPRSGSQ